MRKTLSILALHISLITYCQTIKTVRKIVPIQEKSTYSLDGGVSSTINGQSRVVIEFYLPANTVEWYYIFSSQSNNDAVEDAANRLNLVSQLTRLIDPTGVSASTASSLLAPSGSKQCNIYLLPSEDDANKFYNKTDQSLFDDSWRYNREYSIEAAYEGKKMINGLIYDKCYIGIQNPSLNSSINIAIEIAAIVEEEIADLSEWSSETKEIVFNTCKENLMYNDYNESAATEIASCILQKLINNYTPNDFASLSESESETIEISLEEECIIELQGGEKTEEQEKGFTLGGMGWKAYENGDIEKAIMLSKRALEYDNYIGWVYGNLGLLALIKGDEMAAIDYYVNAIKFVSKDRLNAKETFAELIKDIENAILKYPEIKGYNEILEQLKEEMKYH